MLTQDLEPGNYPGTYDLTLNCKNLYPAVSYSGKYAVGETSCTTLPTPVPQLTYAGGLMQFALAGYIYAPTAA